MVKTPQVGVKGAEVMMKSSVVKMKTPEVLVREGGGNGGRWIVRSGKPKQMQ